MRIIATQDVFGYDEARFVAAPLLTGRNGNVRIIRLTPGQVLPSHVHGPSDLFLLALEGTGTINTDAGDVGLPAGSMAQFDIGEELRISNRGDQGLTLLAFLSPVFPPNK